MEFHANMTIPLSLLSNNNSFTNPDSAENGFDRLGFELYAKALANHIASIEQTREAISVGFLPPWGSGDLGNLIFGISPRRNLSV